MEIPIPALDGFAVTAAAFVRLLLGNGCQPAEVNSPSQGRAEGGVDRRLARPRAAQAAARAMSEPILISLD